MRWGITIRVLISDNQGVLRAGLNALLHAEPGIEVVGDAASGDQTLLMAEKLQPDVVLTDVDLPVIDGIEVISRLRSLIPAARVVVLTVYESDEMLWKSLQVGAVGYVPKRASGRELIQAIRSVAQGDLYIHPVMIKGLITRPVHDDTPAAPPARHGLSSRENDVLRLLALGYTNREMARVLKIGVRTVESHRARLMEKLGMHSRSELVQFAAKLHLGPPFETLSESSTCPAGAS